MSKAVFGYAAHSPNAQLVPFQFNRREVGLDDVQIEILYCGVCHSDIHTARNEWKSTKYPVVPGHEIVGRVTQVGKEVSSFQAGDLVAVGCMVDSCRSCSSCLQGEEQYCDKGAIYTYNSPEKETGGTTYGGYSTHIVVDKKFVLRVPSAFSESDLPGVAPLLCAGITTYSPLKHWGITHGKKVGVVGFGGLGHMAIKIARALGAYVVLFTTSEKKVQDALALGAHEVVISKKDEEMEKLKADFDFIIDTVSMPHNLDAYAKLLKLDGTLCLVGLPENPHPSPWVGNLIFKRRSIAGSLIGGIKETQEMLDFCAEHGITSNIELISMDKINEAYERMIQSDVKYRFVIDMSTLKNR